MGSDQFCKSPHIEGVLSECAHVEGSYLKGDKGERRGNTQKAPPPRLVAISNFSQ